MVEGEEGWEDGLTNRSDQVARKFSNLAASSLNLSSPSQAKENSNTRHVYTRMVYLGSLCIISTAAKKPKASSSKLTQAEKDEKKEQIRLEKEAKKVWKRFQIIPHRRPWNQA